MAYCPACGAGCNPDDKFCKECGARLKILDSSEPERHMTAQEEVLWEGKPYLKEIARNTNYVVTNQRILITTGLLGRKEEQIDLARVKDIRMTQGLSDRIMGIGQIEIISTDPSTPEFRLVGVKDPQRVRDLIWEATNRRRKEMGIRHREIL
ncbi:MAG: PH domain-containing protein [Bacillota bacterium]|nr:PH domain-containing protein [Bacillota bacterium]HOL51442.1 PH domain-containing protein [Bacillota bacterium]HOO29589.1 PH domain-containing protein [Bacillota bacterium]HPQ02693.1 PH domain-containing protein [Bacillota bacterium]HPZ12812.1 PH domain-containing protein [Bacillota bacterium]